MGTGGGADWPVSVGVGSVGASSGEPQVMQNLEPSSFSVSQDAQRIGGPFGVRWRRAPGW